MKKRKLNSKNPKYNKDIKENELVIVKKIPIKIKGEIKGYGVWYEKDN